MRWWKRYLRAVVVLNILDNYSCFRALTWPVLWSLGIVQLENKLKIEMTRVLEECEEIRAGLQTLKDLPTIRELNITKAMKWHAELRLTQTLQEEGKVTSRVAEAARKLYTPTVRVNQLKKTEVYAVQTALSMRLEDSLSVHNAMKREMETVRKLVKDFQALLMRAVFFGMRVRCLWGLWGYVRSGVAHLQMLGYM